ncbi:MAG TPA: tRNA pseudouridine(55) synthase TruB [Vicinamibacterales bacterium]|jgi:tRNA pseudouridine55 synthase|nr:tRNA pseudouridine(55) synthase TruB [Vicinamibacterales bacterium]
MDGLLVIDKPAGPTSHDVVARLRRVLRERRIGHTGTLDPAATGVLPLVIGRATRLARFMSAADKSYDAIVQLGVRTDTADLEGRPIDEPYTGPLPSRDRVDAALDPFRGSFLQQPPAFSAKKIAGRRSYALARAARDPAREADTGGGAPRPAPARVTAHAIQLIAMDADKVTLKVDCSAGFYVRALAHDLGERLGIGACLVALRRTRSADFTLDQAIPLDAAERDAAGIAGRVIPMKRLLTSLSAVALTVDGLRHVAHGRDVGPGDFEEFEEFDAVEPGGLPVVQGTGAPGVVQGIGTPGVVTPSFLRLLDPTGELVGVATPSGASGLLHPVVVLM